MFFLAEIQENIRLSPGKLRYSFIDAITDALNTKYCNKVVVDLGLCINVFDILEAEDPYVHPGEPNAFVKSKDCVDKITRNIMLAKFRLVVMRPFEGELLIGKIRSCGEEGLHIDMGFFQDVFIPANCLQPGTFFDKNENLFVWRYQENDLYMDIGERIRFRLMSSAFVEEAPMRKEVLMAAKRAAAALPGAPVLTQQGVEEEPTAKPESIPYKLIGSIAEDGLGLLTWWGSA